jgi:thiamine biosynthesis lipoprotein
LVRLNQIGRLDPAPAELLDVLRLCDLIHHASDGGFDPTVQPLWHATATAGDTNLARNLVGWDAVQLTETSIALARPGMALTLNGIAQGYIADRIAGWLAAQGFRDVLVDTGEIVAQGHSGAGRPWQAAIAGPEAQIVKRVNLSGRALATSATHAGTGRVHILDPRGRPVRCQLVSVSAALAALADGLSTALCLVPASKATDLVAQFDGAHIEWLG